jgi:flavin-dependent dehydrogenase
MPDPRHETCDVLVIGGGPAGSTASALLAGRGFDVLMLEKATHPRFHIGESLLPRNLAILERLGMRDAVAAMGVFKPGAEFVSDDTGKAIAFPFDNNLDGKETHAYQVLRSQFDEALFRNAMSKGARGYEGISVTGIRLATASAPAEVTAEAAADGAALTIAPRFILDASGRDALIARKLGTQSVNKHNNTAAVFAHYRNVEARTGETEGYISVHLSKDGWFWLIPLPDGVMSVGFVGNQSAFKKRQGPIEAFLEARIKSSRTVAPRMAAASRISDVHSAGNYSYSAASAWGEGYFLIGDAFAFIDPVFSSGVMLAMSAAELGAGVAGAWLQNQAAGRHAARAAELQMRASMRGVSWLIYRINDPVLRQLFMSPRNLLRMRDGIITILAGNLAGGRRARLPVLAFKAVFAIAKALHRLGLNRAGAVSP